jgi:hypothetical protein
VRPTDPDPLAGLEAVPWQQLEHAYGPASDVPALLAAVRADDDRAGEAIDELFSTICHQGTVYSATVPAVPFIAMLALDDGLPVERRALLALLLFMIARGEGYYRVHGDDEGSLPPGELHSQLAEENRIVTACRQAVAQVVPTFVAGARAGVLPRPVWAATIGLALATGVTTNLAAVLEDLPSGATSLLQAGTAVIRELVDAGSVAREAVQRATALDEDLDDYLDTDMDDLDHIPADHYFVDLLVERMVAAELDRP